jgi:dihydroorotate dehydrogenase
MLDLYAFAGPVLRLLPPELAHRLSVGALAAGLAGRASEPDDPILAIDLWGRHFPNPIGLAAGFDKDGAAPDRALALGFGSVEIGSVTPLPQPGNPRPRLFRLTEDRAVINRMGFNSEGHAAVAARLAHRERVGILGVNLGRNKSSEDAAADFALGVRRFGALADYLVVNLSSPNTPGLRALQGREPLEALLDKLAEARGTLPGGRPPLLVKIAPDLVDDELADIVAVARAKRVDGLIVGNTTVARPDALRSHHKREAGGLSGAPLFAPSTRILARVHALSGGGLPLIGCGGVASGADAYAKIRAGASLVQLYTALIYEGPGLVVRIKHDLAALLRRDGFQSVSQAVGVDAKR